MQIRTIAITLMLLVAGLVIGCSSAPEAPAAPVPNLTEKEAIGIARSAVRARGTAVINDSCWRAKSSLTNFAHTESATFKPSGVWVITIKNSWNEDNEDEVHTFKSGNTITKAVEKENLCTYAVNDSSAIFVSN
jgi:hypothetical protein